jgi:hypothetical protein
MFYLRFGGFGLGKNFAVLCRARISASAIKCESPGGFLVRYKFPWNDRQCFSVVSIFDF